MKSVLIADEEENLLRRRRMRAWPRVGGTVVDTTPPPGLTLPQAVSATLLLDLEVDTLALSDGDPVSAWVDQSGNGHDFTQAGDLRPTYKASHEGYPAVYFGGYVNIQYMTSPAFADALGKFAVFAITKFDQDVNDDNYLISKDDAGYGWSFDYSNSVIAANTTLEIKGDTNFTISKEVSNPDNNYVVANAEWLGSDTGHAFIDGDNTGEATGGGLTGSFSNSADVILGGLGLDLPDDGYSGWVRAVLIYQITDYSTWNTTDRAAITAWLAARYGITL